MQTKSNTENLFAKELDIQGFIKVWIQKDKGKKLHTVERDTEKRGKDKMKGVKFIGAILLIITFFVCLNMGLVFVDNVIVRECEVEYLADNVAYFKDGSGNIWGWECGKNEGYSLGQKAKLIMNDNNTKELKDDFILKIKVDKRK